MSVSIKYLPSSHNDESIRPNSHQLPDAKGLKRKNHASVKVLRRLPQSSAPKILDKDLLFKIKPKQISIDKEQLFQENMQLKLKNHSISEEVVRLKTKCSMLEQEICKMDKGKDNLGIWDKSNSLNLTQSLKQTVKDLKNSLESKDQEIYKLKSNLKCSRTNELEAELQAYIDECTRLRHHLEETIKVKTEFNDPDPLTAQALDQLQKDKSQLELLNKDLNDEIKELKAIIDEEKKKKKMVVKKPEVNPRAEIQKLKLLLSSKEKELKDKEKDSKEKEKIWLEKEEKYKNELNSLKSRIDMTANKFKQNPGNFLMFKPSAPNFFKVINLCLAKKGIKELLEGMKYLKTINQINDYLKSSFPQFKLSYLSEILDLFRIKKPELVHDLVKEWFSVYDYTSSNPELDHEVDKQLSKPLKSGTIVPKINPTQSEPVLAKIDNSPKAKKSSENRSKTKEPDSRKQSNKPNSPPIDKEKISSRPQSNSKLPLESPKAKKPEKPEKLEKISFNDAEEEVKQVKISENTHNMWEKISMALQINRLSKEEFKNFLPEPFSTKTLVEVLISEPFNFDPTQAEDFCSSILNSLSPRLKPSKLEENFFQVYKQSTEDWKIFTQEQEDEFNNELAAIVDRLKPEIYEKCKKIDKDIKEVVTLDEFKGILTDLGADLNDLLWKYCKLLFYSCNEELGKVPYVYFLNNYGKEENENSEDDENDEDDQKIASIVRQYIEQIAEKLIENRSSVKSAFIHTAGYISAAQFEESLEKLGIPAIPPSDLELMLQALQDEDSDEVCILIDELEEILNNYGVVADELGTEVINSVDKEDETLKIGNSEEAYEEDYDEYSDEYND